MIYRLSYLEKGIKLFGKSLSYLEKISSLPFKTISKHYNREKILRCPFPFSTMLSEFSLLLAPKANKSSRKLKQDGGKAY